MTRAVPLTAFVAALLLSFGLGITQAERSSAAQPPSNPRPPLPRLAADSHDLQVLLSSIDMTVSLAVVSDS